MEEKITLFLVEVGVLLSKKDKECADYSQVFDKKHAYYDENFLIFLESANAAEYAFSYVMKNNVNTYAVVKQVEVPKEYLEEEHIQEIKDYAIFEGWDVVLMDERFDAKNIVLDIYKKNEGTIKYNFIEKEK